jgi:phosphatidylinositol glycan class W
VQATNQLAQLLQQLGDLRKPFISAFRGGLMLYTCIGILAVDFHAFPRRYAKAERCARPGQLPEHVAAAAPAPARRAALHGRRRRQTLLLNPPSTPPQPPGGPPLCRYGTGLMDMGVGAIVFASGLVSRPAAQEQLGRLPLARRAAQGARSSAPALALGLARLAATRALGYQEHVGEYGAHWNFFLTAGLVALLAQAAALPSRWLGPAGLALALGHQAALSLGGGPSWLC